MRYFIILLIFLGIYNIPLHAQQVQWASEVIGYSSEYKDVKNPAQYSAQQVLGKPSVFPYKESPCAWLPAQDNTSEEWIKVKFTTPTSIKQVAVAESFNPGGITYIYAYTPDGHEHVIYQNPNIAPIALKGRMFNLYMKQTSFKVVAIKVVINPIKISGKNQIDAIGISDSDAPIKININLTETLHLKSKVENLGKNVNSTYEEIAPSIAPDGKTLYFTRAGHPENLGTAKKQDIWTSEINPDSSFKPAVNMGAPLNTPDHNSSFSISPDGNTMLLNNAYLPEGTLKKGLSITRKTGKTWGRPQEITIEDFYNTNDYAEFYLAQDGKTLLMTIQRKDAYGDRDMYASFLKADKNWSIPMNLGNIVNTAATEISPFLASDGVTLYYSTSGFPGYGSSDIFVTRRLDDTWKNWSEPQNLGNTINSNAWEAYFSLTASGAYAYFVSAKNSLGGTDVFRVKIQEKARPKPVALLQGKVYNAVTKEPISATIAYHNLETGEDVGNAISNGETGDYKLVLPLGKSYSISAEAKGYFPITENIDLTGKTIYEEITKDLYLIPIKKGNVVRLNNIFFARSEYDLLPTSYPELDRLATMLKDNPKVVIRLEGHTEPMGNKKALMELSKNRIHAVEKYLLKKGIVGKRIESKAFGGTKPIAKGDTEESRQLNRRVEVQILKD